MKRLILAVAALSLTACDGGPEAPETLAGRWEVQQIAGASLGQGVDIWMEIDAENGAISGYTGCNTFSAPLTSFNEMITVGAITEDAGECLNEAAATDEARFLLVLPRVQRHIRRGASLELLEAPSGSETLIRLRAVEVE